MSEITMPRLSDSMEQATVIKWLKTDGDRVTAGEELVEVETDKATVTVRVEHDGILSIVAAEGETVAVGAPIARLTAATEQLGAAPEIAVEPGEPAEVVASTRAAATATPVRPNGSQGPVALPTSAHADVPSNASVRRAVTPLARRVARLHGVELGGISGTGPRGRITRDDVLAAAGITTALRSTPAHSSGAAIPPAGSTSEPATDGTAPTVTHRFTRLQQLIARRMTKSRTTIPEFEVQTDVVMDEAVALRQQLRAPNGDNPLLPSINDLIVRACALALRRHPGLNASYSDESLRIWPSVNVGVAVATDDALIVPILRDADRLSLGQIAAETQRLSARVRAGEISPAELEGGTFTVSNLGMRGMTAIRPVINHPQVAILGVGAVRDTLARVEGEIVDRKVMTLTLSADHRAVYGVDAARFLGYLRSLLERPLRILL